MASGPVIILGSGLTGLSAAVALKRRGIAVTVLESAARAGGAVQTEESDGFLVECGPNSMMVNEPEVISFLQEASSPLFFFRLSRPRHRHAAVDPTHDKQNW